MLLVAGISSVAGYALTLLLPEPARRNLEEVSGEDRPPATPIEVARVPVGLVVPIADLRPSGVAHDVVV